MKRELKWDKVIVEYDCEYKGLKLTIKVSKHHSNIVRLYKEGTDEFESLIYLAKLHGVCIKNF